MIERKLRTIQVGFECKQISIKQAMHCSREENHRKENYTNDTYSGESDGQLRTCELHGIPWGGNIRNNLNSGPRILVAQSIREYATYQKYTPKSEYSFTQRDIDRVFVGAKLPCWGSAILPLLRHIAEEERNSQSWGSDMHETRRYKVHDQQCCDPIHL